MISTPYVIGHPYCEVVVVVGVEFKSYAVVLADGGVLVVVVVPNLDVVVFLNIIGSMWHLFPKYRYGLEPKLTILHR